MNQMDLKALVTRARLMDFLSYRDFLSHIYELGRGEFQGYSYRKFSDDLGFSSTNISWLFVTGRRSLTPTSTRKICRRLGLEGAQKKYFEALVKYNNARLPKQREEWFQRLKTIKAETVTHPDAKRMLEYFSEWYHPVIREMAGLEGFQSDPEWIAKRLYNKVLPKQIVASLQLLESLKLIRFDKTQGRHVQSGDAVAPPPQLASIAMTRFHEQMIVMGAEAIHRIPSQEREINAMTLCMNQGTAMKVKQIIVRACEDIMKLETDQEEAGDHVYQFNIQMFPFTKPD